MWCHLLHYLLTKKSGFAHELLKQTHLEFSESIKITFIPIIDTDIFLETNKVAANLMI